MLYAGAGLVLVLIIGVMVYFTFRSRTAKQAASLAIPARTAGTTHFRNLDYQPRAKPVSPLRKTSTPHPSEPQEISSPHKTVSVTDGRTDITDSIRALVEKYSLVGFTLATTDGLIFASYGNADAMEDSARYGDMSLTGKTGIAPGITLFAVSCEAADLTGIIHAAQPLNKSVLRMIGEDTQEILNRWI